jgi:hypothetical protein
MRFQGRAGVKAAIAQSAEAGLGPAGGKDFATIAHN